jgi:LacI family transcriptional regulator
MHEIGLDVPPEMIVVGDHRMEGGMRALVQLAGLPERPTAILCSNDMTAVGVMREAYEHGIVIPRDLSLVGFDDIRLSQFTTPPLTTVQMSQRLLAEYAFQALRTEAERTSSAPAGNEYELLTTLVLRRSTALAPADNMSWKPPKILTPSRTNEKSAKNG